MKNLVHRVRRLGQRRDEGASAVEYGLLVALIAVVIAGAVTLLGQALDNKFESVTNCVSSTDANCADGGTGTGDPD